MINKCIKGNWIPGHYFGSWCPWTGSHSSPGDYARKTSPMLLLFSSVLPRTSGVCHCEKQKIGLHGLLISWCHDQKTQQKSVDK